MDKRQLKQIKKEIRDLEECVKLEVVQNDVTIKDIYKNNATVKKDSIIDLSATCSKPKYMEYKIIETNGHIEYIRLSGRQHGIFKENTKFINTSELMK